MQQAQSTLQLRVHLRKTPPEHQLYTFFLKFLLKFLLKLLLKFFCFYCFFFFFFFFTNVISSSLSIDEFSLDKRIAKVQLRSIFIGRNLA
jgi:hypothetical protein